MRPRFKIIITDHLRPVGVAVLVEADDVEVVGPFPRRDELLHHLGDAAALIVRSAMKVDAALLDAAPALRAVARAGARFDNIDVDAATRRGVMVMNVPAANLYAAAEHTFGMLLALVRGIPEGADAVRRGEWPRHRLLGVQLHGKTLGIIGFGRLGREVALRALAFGMKVLAYDPFADFATARTYGVDVVPLDELLSQADIVTLHASLTPATRGIVKAETLRKMKRGAYLVNAMHAELVDEGALLDSLEAGHLAGAALDTFKEEPPPHDYPLTNHPRVLALPHLNQNTVESQDETSVQVVRDVLAALRGEDYRNVVNLPFDERVTYAEAKPYIDLAVRLGKLQGQLAEGWISRVEIELQGDDMARYVRPAAAALLSGLLRPDAGQRLNWVNAPLLAHEQGIQISQAKELLPVGDYPNLVICKVGWGEAARTVAGALFANGEARLVHYDGFSVDALPDGYVLILENDDVPGVIGKVGTRLGLVGINIASWRYGREVLGGRAFSFINLDSCPQPELLAELEQTAEIHKARVVRL